MRTSDVIKHFGSQVEVARFLKISRSAVCQWPDLVPEVSARKLEKLTNGALFVDEQSYPPKGSAAA